MPPCGILNYSVVVVSSLLVEGAVSVFVVSLSISISTSEPVVSDTAEVVCVLMVSTLVVLSVALL